MPNQNTPRGFKPLRYNDGRPYSGAVNTYRLPSGYATNLFAGDVVKELTTGYLAKALPGDQMRGIVAGFSYVDAANQLPRYTSLFPAGLATFAGADVLVAVIDDPGVVFEAVFTNSATVPGIAQAGKLFNLYDAGGTVATQISGEGIDLSTQSTAAGQFRAMRAVQRVDNDPLSAYQRWEFTPASQDFRVNSGV